MPGNDFAEPDGTSSGSLAAVTRYAVDAQPLSINSPAATPSVKFLRVFMSLFLCCFVLDRINRIYKIVFKQCSAGDAEEFRSAFGVVWVATPVFLLSLLFSMLKPHLLYLLFFTLKSCQSC